MLWGVCILFHIAGASLRPQAEGFDGYLDEENGLSQNCFIKNGIALSGAETVVGWT